ncbi:MAG: hypothetical protein M0P43_08740 [Arcobacteraceae bacterium]|nr:hypothetical protein [Arcobacteraceae bacterium]
MNKENFYVIVLFVFLGTVGYIFGYILSSFFDKNETLKEVIHLLGALIVVTTFYSPLKTKLFKILKLEDENDS